MVAKLDKMMGSCCPRRNPSSDVESDSGYRRWVEDNGYKSFVYGDLSQREKDEGLEYNVPTPEFLACLSAIFVLVLSVILWQMGSLYFVLSSLVEKLLELSYVVAVLLPFAGKYARGMEKRYGEFGVLTLLRAELRREIREVAADMEHMVQTIPSHVKAELKELPKQVQNAAKTAFETSVSELDSKLHDVEARIKHALESKLGEIQVEFKELPGHVKHAAEETCTLVIGELGRFKQHWREDLVAQEQNLKEHLQKLPAEFEHLVQVQLHKLTNSMEGMTNSIQSEFTVVKSHVTGLKDHVTQRVKGAGSVCGSVSRDEPTSHITRG